MKAKFYYLSQQSIVYIPLIVVTVFLQNCFGLSNDPTFIEEEKIDNVLEAGTQVSPKQLADKKFIFGKGHEFAFYQKTDQIQIETQKQEVAGSFNRAYNSVEYIKKDMREGQLSNLNQEEQTKFLQVDSPQISQSEHIYTDSKFLQKPEKGKKKEEQQKKGYGQGDVKFVEEMQIADLGNPKEVIKYNKKTTTMCIGDLVVFPIELLEKVLSYLSYSEIIKARQINRFFNELITGYSQPGLMGVEHKPNRHIYLEACAVKKNVDLSKFNLGKLPSFFFYQFIRQVLNLPREFWPYLRETNIHTFTLCDISIGITDVMQLMESLQGTKIHTLTFSRNNVEPAILVELAKCLHITEVYTFNLHQNSIGSRIGEFAKNLQKSKVHTISLKANNIGDLGVVVFVKNLEDINVHTINLDRNNMSIAGAVELAKSLQGTKVSFISLSENEINNREDVLLGEFTKNLQGGKIQEINLSFNKIGAEGIGEFAKNLQGSLVRKIDLSWNNIGAAGVLEFATNLAGTNVEELNLSSNKIIWDKIRSAKEIMEFAKSLSDTKVRKVNLSSNGIMYLRERALLVKHYPHIEWKF